MEKMKLRDSGKLVEEAWYSHYLVEFRPYANDNRVKFLPKWKEGNDGKVKMEMTKLTSSLRSLYKELCELITKVMMSHTGNVSTITWPKLKVLAALTDEVTKIELYNWCQFMIEQLMEASKSVV